MTCSDCALTATAQTPVPPAPWSNPKVLTSVSSGALILAAWLAGLAGIDETTSTIIYIIAALAGGYYFGREALEEFLFEREIGIELLMTVAAIVAAVMGQVEEAAILAFLYSISEAAEAYTGEKTRSAIRALMDLTPKTALVRRQGAEVRLPVEEIAVGDIFIVKPGEAVATDGLVVMGASSLNQAPVTGESAPVEKRAGDAVFAGTINGEGAIEVRATKTFANNTIARIIELVERAREKKGKSQRFIERFGARYSPLVLVGGVVIALVPPLLLDGQWETWITRATVFVVAAAPCALVISIPITLVAALGTGARQGVLIKGGLYVEELSKIKVVAFDKTGTLTRGEPEVTDVIAWKPEMKERDLISLAAGVEQRSQHPLARAVLERAALIGVAPTEVRNFRSITGVGAVADTENGTVYATKPDFFLARRLLIDAQIVQIEGLEREGKTVVMVGDEGHAWGLIAMRDNLRPNARKTIEALRAAGITKVIMLSGDNRHTADVVAREAGVDEVHANLKPEDKVAKVRQLEQRYGRVAMVGDGVNDAPALAEATVGVAMGAAGTDVALETADVALMADDLEKLVYALTLARRNQSVVRQNLALSSIVIGVLVMGALTGYFTLTAAVVAHEFSEFVVIASGLRLLRA